MEAGVYCSLAAGESKAIFSASFPTLAIDRDVLSYWDRGVDERITFPCHLDPLFPAFVWLFLIDHLWDMCNLIFRFFPRVFALKKNIFLTGLHDRPFQNIKASKSGDQGTLLQF